MRSDYTIPVYHYSKIFNVKIDLDYWRNKNPVFPEDALIWFTDGSKASSGTGSGIFGLRPNRSLSFPLGKFATVFQTEIYAILQCACENIRRVYKNKRILIFSDSQAALKALSNPKVTFQNWLLNALSVLAGMNEVNLIWALEHCSFRGNEEVDKLARQHQPYRYLVQSRLLECLSVQQEKQLRTGLSINFTAPGELCQVLDMASFL